VGVGRTLMIMWVSVSSQFLVLDHPGCPGKEMVLVCLIVSVPADPGCSRKLAVK